MDYLENAAVTVLLFTNGGEIECIDSKEYSESFLSNVKNILEKFESILSHYLGIDIAELAEIFDILESSLIYELVYTIGGHGCGLWESEYAISYKNIDNLGEYLTNLLINKHYYDEDVCLYVGDDDKLYFYNDINPNLNN